MGEYTFRPLDLSETGIKDISALLKVSSLNRIDKTPQLLNWQYNLNPLGKAIGYNAYFGQALVAHYLNQPIQATIHGDRVKGLLSFNIATHPDHRKQGLFVHIADLTYQLAKTLGYEFVIGVANENSIHGLRNKLGHKVIRPLEVKIGIGKFSVSFNHNAQYERYWDQELLAWRLSNPGRNYEIKSYDEFNVILTPMNKLGIRAIVGCFPKTITLPNIKTSSSSVLNPMIWAGLDPYINWKNSAYCKLPDYLKSSPLILHYKSLSKSFSKLDAADIRFRGIDFDVF